MLIYFDLWVDSHLDVCSWMPALDTKLIIQVIALAFVTLINGIGGEPEINFANSGDDCQKFPGTGLLDCPRLG